MGRVRRQPLLEIEGPYFQPYRRLAALVPIEIHLHRLDVGSLPETHRLLCFRPRLPALVAISAGALALFPIGKSRQEAIVRITGFPGQQTVGHEPSTPASKQDADYQGYEHFDACAQHGL